ncbi:MAG: DinB family protein [Flavobacteriaceae bacterium]
MENLILKELKKNAVFRLEEGQRMIHVALAKIREESLWQLPIANGLSLGNQLLHICGNMNQYAVASLGEQLDTRKRDLEFSTKEGFSKADLLKKLDHTVFQAIQTIQTTSEAKYCEIRRVQGFEFSGVGVLLHAVEHFSYHIGQIAFWIKKLTQEDLGFYKNHDLTQTND